MKTTTVAIALTVFLFACTPNKQEQLAKLKGEHDKLAQSIDKLEKEISAEKGDSSLAVKSKKVAVAEINYQPFVHNIKVYGHLDGDQNSSVFAEASGAVIAKYADVGQSVKKGQVLAQIDDAAVQRQLQGLQSQFDFALEMYNKQTKLWNQKIGSETQYLEVKSKKEALEQQIAATKAQLENFKIKAPCAGNIEECNIKVGGFVTPNPSLVAYRVVSFGELKIVANVSEAYIAKVTKGDKVNVTFPDINTTINSQINFVSKYINPVNRTFSIEVRLQGNNMNLKANMIAVVNINDYHNDKAIVVSQNLIQSDGTGSFILVAKQVNNQSVAAKQRISQGLSNNGLTEITSGLNPGDKIITAGYQDLVEGANIKL